MSVFFFFGLATVVGVLSTLFWIPEDDLGRGYFQMNALIVLGLLALVWSVVALYPFSPFGPEPVAGLALLAVGYVASFVYYGAVWKERWKFGRWPLAVAFAACTAALLMAGPNLINLSTPLPHREIFTALSLASSALLLGWSLIAMLLGHWYLVAPGLTFRHLIIFCWVLLGVVVVRVVVLAVTLGVAAGVDPLSEPHPLRILIGLEAQGMFFWFRLLWGLAIPLALAAMSLHCARQRSNQSATGILYVLVVGTFIGEITAYYLALTTGVPS